MCKRLIFLISVTLVLCAADYTSAAVDAEIPIGSPAIDGDKDDLWSRSDEHSVKNLVVGVAPVNGADLSASWRALWDTENLYIFVDVNDSDLRDDDPIGGESWHDDSVGIMFDINDDDLTAYGEDDYEYRVEWGTSELEEHWNFERSWLGVEIAVSTKNVGSGDGGRGDGYTIEIKFPWSTLDFLNTGATGLDDFLGVDVSINDQDGPGDRDTQLCWHDTTGQAWQNPSVMGTVQLVRSTQAFSPVPTKGAENVICGLLMWEAGRYADDVNGHDVYFGTDSTPDATEFIQRQSETSYNAALEPNTTYYWRIDEVNEYGPDPCFWEGDIWYFTTAPVTAHTPYPPDGAKWIDVDADIYWISGFYAKTHIVCFGTDIYVPEWPWNFYDPGTLEAGTTYYWHIDEVNDEGPDPCLWEGDIWSFTTLNAGAGIKAEYYNSPNILPNPTITVTEYSIDFDWGEDSPHPAIPDDDWAARFTMELEIPITGTYTFYTVRAPLEDGVRLWIDGELVISRWTAEEEPGEEPFEDSASIDLDVGLVPVVFEFYDTLEAARAQLWWECSVIPKEIIPRDQYYLPRRAVSPSPGPGEIDISSTPILSWTPGMFAATHDVYFGTNEAAVTDANRTNDPCGILIKQGLPSVLPTTSYDITADIGTTLEFDTTYYWRIDDVNDDFPGSPWKGYVRSFTTGRHHVLEDFERYYNPAITDVWTAAGGASIDESSETEEYQIHEGTKAMAYSYNNSGVPYCSEANADSSELNNIVGSNWRLQNVKALSLWFRGRDFRGSFTGLDPYWVTADGLGLLGDPDTEPEKDYFYFVNRYVAGQSTGQVQARVDSLDAANTSAIAGVMLRQSTAQDSKYAALFVTADNKVVFQQRRNNGNTYLTTVSGITLPRWLRLGWNSTPMPNGTWVVKHAPDNNGQAGTWVTISAAPPFTAYSLTFGNNIYLGLCVTSNNDSDMCTAGISNVSMQSPFGTPITPPLNLTGQDIGKAYNDPESMYVVLQDSDSNGIVYHPEPNVTQIGEWTQWRIDLNDFCVQDVNLADVQKIYIGFGNKESPTPGGSGTVYIDDIRLYQAEFYEPECPPWPPDLARDGSIDYGDIAVIVNYWLQTPPDPNIDLYIDGTIDFRDIAELGNIWGQKQVWPTW